MCKLMHIYKFNALLHVRNSSVLLKEMRKFNGDIWLHLLKNASVARFKSVWDMLDIEIYAFFKFTFNL